MEMTHDKMQIAWPPSCTRLCSLAFRRHLVCLVFTLVYNSLSTRLPIPPPPPNPLSVQPPLFNPLSVLGDDEYVP